MAAEVLAEGGGGLEALDLAGGGAGHCGSGLVAGREGGRLVGEDGGKRRGRSRRAWRGVQAAAVLEAWGHERGSGLCGSHVEREMGSGGPQYSDRGNTSCAHAYKLREVK